MRHGYLFLFFLLTFSIWQTSSARAQEQEYAQFTRATLSQLYWRYNHLDINNDRNIDNFMLLNRCDMYQKFFYDDFAWHEIRKKARTSIQKNKDQFPRYVEIAVPIRVGRYDVQKQRFPIMDMGAATDMIEIRALDSQDFECDKYVEGSTISNYPHKAILVLNRALDTKYIKSPYEMAMLYNQNFEHYPKNRHRPATMVLKVKIFDADPTRNPINKNETAMLTSIIEEIEFYGDADRILMLGYVDKRRKKLTEEGE